MTDHRPIIVPVGGFLGAGKTTLILAAARMLRARELRVAAVFNDQGAELVDSRLARANGLDNDQVTGGCFCCRFAELIDAVERLRDYSPDVIFAEAAGSCADISATVLQPLKLYHSRDFRLAAFSVLVDAQQAAEAVAPGADPDLSFLFRKQIEEADLICFTKTDRNSRFPELAGAPLRFLSAATGEGVEAWLDEVLAGQMRAGGKILEIDYERYARAEAALAWLNCSVTVELPVAVSPAMLVGPLHAELEAALTAANIPIVHLKLMDESEAGHLKLASIRNGAEPVVEGALDASPARRHELLLNVRAAGDPVALQRIVERQLSKLPGKVDVTLMQCFRPSAPQPQHRMAAVVST